MFSQLFYNYFLLCLIVNDLQMHFSLFFYFPPPFLFLLSKFSIFNPTFSILKKPACFYQFAPAFQQKTPAFFLFIPTFPNQINGNRFQSSLDLLSIPVYLSCSYSITYLLLPQAIFLYTLHTAIHLPNYQLLPVKGVKSFFIRTFLELCKH